MTKEAGITVRSITGDGAHDYILEANGNGAAFFDFDVDGDLDLLLVSGSTLQALSTGGHRMTALYMNDGTGRFTDITTRSGLTRYGWGMGVCVADYDHDGFPDAYLTAYGPNVLYRNNGDGTFTDVTEHAGVGDRRWSHSCAFGDYDRDGYVDLYVTNYLSFDEKTIPKRGASSLCRYLGHDVFCGPLGLEPQSDVLYRNNGDGTFTEATQAAGVDAPASFGMGVLFTDTDGDGWLDILVGNDSEANFLFKNKRDGTFEEIGLLVGIALDESGKAQASMGIAGGDYDNDGDLDLLVTNFSQDYNTLYKNHGNGIFSDVTTLANLAQPSMKELGWGTGFVDFDNDGWRDLFVANGHVYDDVDGSGIGSTYLQKNQLFLNRQNQRFRDITKEVGGGLLVEASSRGAAFGDLDNDGDMDVVIVNMNDVPSLLRNETQNGHRWVSLQLIGGKSNRDGIGARLVATSGDLRQTAEVSGGGSYLSHSDLRVHFGLGSASEVDRVEIHWPLGGRQVFHRLPADRILVVRGAAAPQADGREAAQEEDPSSDP